MRNYAKVGGRQGLPGYRTPATFRAKVLKIVAKIPKGQTLTYAEVAKRAGSVKAARAVGNILHKNYDQQIPCHRVVRSDGKPGGYNRGVVKKLALLNQEAREKYATKK